MVLPPDLATDAVAGRCPERPRGRGFRPEPEAVVLGRQTLQLHGSGGTRGHVREDGAVTPGWEQGWSGRIAGSMGTLFCTLRERCWRVIHVDVG